METMKNTIENRKLKVESQKPKGIVIPTECNDEESHKIALQFKRLLRHSFLIPRNDGFIIIWIPIFTGMTKPSYL